MVDPIDDYEFIGIIAQSDCRVSQERIVLRGVKERRCRRRDTLVCCPEIARVVSWTQDIYTSLDSISPYRNCLTGWKRCGI
uniref:ORF80 of the trkA gene locus n=1 Tax=Methanosarcina mazei TaxID=2209 RepID=O53134_METMZ|nr:unnamed protein product [Methanosarcina mazei]